MGSFVRAQVERMVGVRRFVENTGTATWFEKPFPDPLNSLLILQIRYFPPPGTVWSLGGVRMQEQLDDFARRRPMYVTLNNKTFVSLYQ